MPIHMGSTHLIASNGHVFQLTFFVKIVSFLIACSSAGHVDLEMSEISEEIDYVMLFYHKKGKTFRKICVVCDENAVSERRIEEWFARFESKTPSHLGR